MTQLDATTRSRLIPTRWVVAVALPLLPVLLITLISLVTTGTPTGPELLLGPWAGLPLGHHCCTMATQRPLASWGVVAAAPCVLGLIRLLPVRLRNLAGPVLLTAWSFAWLYLGLLSVINASM